MRKKTMKTLFIIVCLSMLEIGCRNKLGPASSVADTTGVDGYISVGAMNRGADILFTIVGANIAIDTVVIVGNPVQQASCRPRSLDDGDWVCDPIPAIIPKFEFYHDIGGGKFEWVDCVVSGLMIGNPDPAPAMCAPRNQTLPPNQLPPTAGGPGAQLPPTGGPGAQQPPTGGPGNTQPTTGGLPQQPPTGGSGNLPQDDLPPDIDSPS